MGEGRVKTQSWVTKFSGPSVYWELVSRAGPSVKSLSEESGLEETLPQKLLIRPLALYWMCQDTVTSSCSCRTSCSKPKCGRVRRLEDNHTQVTSSSGLAIPKSQSRPDETAAVLIVSQRWHVLLVKPWSSVQNSLKIPFVRQWESKFKTNNWELCWFWNFIHTESKQCLHYLLCLVEERSILIYSLMFRFCLTATPTSQQTWEWFNLFYGQSTLEPHTFLRQSIWRQLCKQTSSYRKV